MPLWYDCPTPVERREGEERPLAPSMAPRCLVSRSHRLASLRAKSHACRACIERSVIQYRAGLQYYEPAGVARHAAGASV